jgi:glycosyltransferase involved in cell wall biosynthesis
MKIIYLSPHPHVSMHDISGPGVHIREVMHGFQQKGHEVIWASPNKRLADQPIVRKAKSGVLLKKVIKSLLPKIIWESLRDIQLLWIDRQFDRDLQQLIDLHKPDFIYERVYYLMGCGYRVAKRNNVRYLVEINSPYTIEKPLMSYKSLFAPLAERNERKQMEATDQGFVVASSLKEFFIQKYPFTDGKITVTPNAVRKEFTEPATAEVMNQARKELALAEGDILVTFVGSIFPYHGVDILIHAYHDVRKQFGNRLKLLIMGDGEILEDLKSLTVKLGIGHEVTFTGKAPSVKVREYLTVTHIAVLANCNWYSSPIKLFEYGSKRLAIIAPKYPGVEDVMTGDLDGILVDPDQHSLSKAIKLLAEQPEIRERYAQSFHQRVKSHYTWDVIAEQILTFAR